jgi:hypothetical protein
MIFSLLSLLPLLLAPVFYAALVKLSALMFRRTQLKWRQALLYGVLAVVLVSLGKFAILATGQFLLTTLMSVVVQVAFGGWYLKDRARTTSGSPVGFSQAAFLAATPIAFGLVFAVVMPMIAQLPQQ